MKKDQNLMDALFQSMGGYALQKRQLIADYKGPGGGDLEQDLTVWHSRGTSDQSLVSGVRADLARRGCTLTALGELLEDGSAMILYVDPDALKELAHSSVPR